MRRALARLRWQLTLSHLIAIVVTLVSMVAALILIAGSWIAVQTGPDREAGNDAAPPVLMAGALQVDLAQHTVTVEGDAVDLTPKEFDLLALLVRNPGRAFARDYLLEKVWGYDYGGFDRTVDTHVLRLRKKLGDSGDQIETVWGVGYRLAARPKGST